jgi:hypothetical protein
MKKQLTYAVMSLALVSGASAQIQTNAFDAGSNYGGAGEPGWTNGANTGFGFGPWEITLTGTGFKGNFIGDPSSAGISGMSTESFGLYANPADSTALVSISRQLTTPLQVGQTFSLQFGMNSPSGTFASSYKGIEITTGNRNYLAEIRNPGSNNTVLFIDPNSDGYDTGFGYGTIPMTWSFTYTDPTNIFVTANDRDGSGTFTTNISTPEGISGFRIFATKLTPGDAAQPYFNDFAVTVPEPSTYALLLLGGAASLWALRRRKS